MANAPSAHYDDHHGLSHVATPKVLLGTFGALMTLTVITVLATRLDQASGVVLAWQCRQSPNSSSRWLSIR